MRWLIICGFLLIAACHQKRPPAPTAEQAAQLNDADDMLNNLANEEGPADRSTGPSNE
jgi:membrane protein involved in colicin uptake